MESSSCKLFTPPKLIRGCETCEVGGEMPCSFCFVSQQHITSSSCAETQRKHFRVSGHSLTLARPDSPAPNSPGPWRGRFRSICVPVRPFQTNLLNIVSLLSPQLGLHWKLSKRKCESSNMMEYVSKKNLNMKYFPSVSVVYRFIPNYWM